MHRSVKRNFCFHGNENIPIIKDRALYNNKCYISPPKVNISIRNLYQKLMGIYWHHGNYVTLKGQGQGQSYENHIMGHNFWTGSRRDFLLVANSSLLNGASVSDHPFWRTTSRFYVTWLCKNKNKWKKYISSNLKGQRSNSRSRSNKGRRSRSFINFHYFVCYRCDIVEFMKNENRLLKSSIFNRFFYKLIYILLGPIRWTMQKIASIRKT